MDLARLKTKLIPVADVLALRPPAPVSAVLIPIGFDPMRQEHAFVMTKRTETLESHRGQVSFPGGILEAEDQSLLATALRESHEEVGLKENDIEILGALPPVFTRNAMQIFPFVGRISLPYPFVLSPTEVARLIYLPAPTLLADGLKPITVEVEGFKVASIGINYAGDLIWGASARMLELILPHLRH